jgi:hypothetical protein
MEIPLSSKKRDGGIIEAESFTFSLIWREAGFSPEHTFCWLFWDASKAAGPLCVAAGRVLACACVTFSRRRPNPRAASSVPQRAPGRRRCRGNHHDSPLPLINGHPQRCAWTLRFSACTSVEPPAGRHLERGGGHGETRLGYPISSTCRRARSVGKQSAMPPRARRPSQEPGEPVPSQEPGEVPPLAQA